MNKLSIKLEYCYGIKKLEKEFIFRNRTFAIYAPNGSMKTSFAKVFKDLIKGEETKDLIYPERKTIREIKDESGIELTKEEVFVIEPYNENYSSDKESTLVVEKELKEQYEKIYGDLDSNLNQTWALFKKYQEEFNNEKESINILKKVNLITPENIHVNSFMYEPILDMGDGELRELYKLVKEKLVI